MNTENAKSYGARKSRPAIMINNDSYYIVYTDPDQDGRNDRKGKLSRDGILRCKGLHLYLFNGWDSE